MSFTVEQEQDRVDRRTVVTVSVISILLIGVALVIAWGILAVEGEPPRRGRNAPPAPRTIATLEQSIILDTERGLDLRKEQKAALDRWEWVDRDAGVLRIPIENAMTIIAEEKR